MTFIVATNVIASQPPEHRPTVMPTTRANYFHSIYMINNNGWYVFVLFYKEFAALFPQLYT